MAKRHMIIAAATAALLSLSPLTAVAAPETIPVVDDTVDYSVIGTPSVTDEDGFIIQSYEITDEEIQLGEALAAPHTHPSKARHYSQTPHSHSIRNIKTGTAKSYLWRPTQVWTRNSSYSNSADWPTVSWMTSMTAEVKKSVNLSVGVTDGTVTSSLGADYTKTHKISTSTTRSFKVPYKKDGRIKVTYSRPYKTFTCVTYYFPAGTTGYETTGAGNAQGKPTNIVVSLETRSI